MIEGLIYMILRGVAIGVLVSAPMGPVGIFCIQRTLDKGRRSGFDTGIGAALSDLTYCLLTGFCLSFIEDFIQRNRMPIQLFGSAVLILFGIYLLKKKPVRPFNRESGLDPPSRSGDILKGFLFTFSNPLILFLIIGLFAQFNFVMEGIRFYHYILGFVSIFAGALGWWWFVTYFVDKLRAHFNVRSMWLINRVIGVIILIFAAFGIYMSVSASPAVAPAMTAGASQTLTGLRGSYAFRVADLHADPMSAYKTDTSTGNGEKVRMPGWNLKVEDSEGEGFVMTVRSTEHSDPFSGAAGHAVVMESKDLRSGQKIGEAVVTEGMDPYKGKNSWKISREGNVWMVFAGNRSYTRVMDHTVQLGSPVKVSVAANPGGSISVTNEDISFVPDIEWQSGSEPAPGIKDPQGIGGIYSLFDYETDENLSKLGGRYRLLISPAEGGEYEMVYLSGATVLPGSWEQGMKKGQMKPTAFPHVYDVEWTDALGEVMERDVHAEYETLTQSLVVKFPYQGTSLRFRKE